MKEGRRRNRRRTRRARNRMERMRRNNDGLWDIEGVTKSKEEG